MIVSSNEDAILIIATFLRTSNRDEKNLRKKFHSRFKVDNKEKDLKGAIFLAKNNRSHLSRGVVQERTQNVAALCAKGSFN